MSFLTYAMSRDFPDTPSSDLETGPKWTPAPSLSKLLRRIADWRRKRADVAALRLMTDHNLRDLGLSRLDVEAISEGAHRLEI